jgi:hypothetical protein
MPAQIKPQPLTEWVNQQREQMLMKVAVYFDDKEKREYFQGQADAYMSVLIHMAANAETN